MRNVPRLSGALARALGPLFALALLLPAAARAANLANPAVPGPESFLGHPASSPAPDWSPLRRIWEHTC